MRTLLFSIIALIASASSAAAFELRGFWLDNKEWDGTQAIVEIYDCKNNPGYCIRIVDAYKGQLQEGQLGYILIRALQPQRNGTFKGRIKPPVNFVGESDVTIKRVDDNNFTYSSCFLPVCKGSMTRIR